MRGFNLMKPTAGEADEEGAPEPSPALSSKRRIILLILLLAVVAAFGARNFMGTYIGRKSGTPLPAPGQIVTPPTHQVPGPSPTPQMPVSTGTPEHPTKAPGLDRAAEPRLTLTPSPEKNVERDLPQARAVQREGPVEHLAPKAALRGRFSVQVAAMAHEPNANALSQKLEKLGYPVTIRKERASTTQHIVLVAAPGDRREEAEALMERLKAEGVPAVVGESDGRYRVEAGRSPVLDQAIDFAHELQKKGFTPKIASETATTTLYRVRVGQFTSRGEAGQRAKELREKGFPALIVKR